MQKKAKTRLFSGLLSWQNNLMSIFQGQRKSCYCAFCKTPKKVYRTKRVGLRHVFYSLIASIALMWGIWETVNPAAIALFAAFLLFSEIFVYLRWRISLVCRQCGFDPSIYLKNPELAAQRVRDYLDRRKMDPRFLLAPSLNLPKRAAPVSVNKNNSQLNADQRGLAPKNSNRGKIISKSV